MAVIRKARFIGTCLVLLLLGCATGVSPQARSQVTYGGSFSKLQGAVGQHKDEIVIFGGKIMETKGYQSASEITVLRIRIGVGPNAINLSPSALMWKPWASFRRKPESSLLKLFCTPAFAAVTV